MLRFLTAGESHGPCLTTIIEGLPAGLRLEAEEIDRDLRRRQGGYGRGGRQQIEQDRVRFLGGRVKGATVGAPLSMMITNKDWENWRERDVSPWTRPRPGHADLAGGQKYQLDDLRLVAERASARETAARVAVGAVAKILLHTVDIEVGSYVKAIGGVEADLESIPMGERLSAALESDVSCPQEDAAQRMREGIDAAREAGDSLGGVFTVVARGLGVGLGSHVHWDRRLDARLARAVMGIQAVKGVEIGPAFANAALPGTQVHDPIYPGESGPQRKTNRAGGLEGGMSNGQPIVISAAMKPIPTTVSPIATVDLATGEATTTEYQRSDVCAVPAAAVVGEAMVAWVLAQALLERYGGDHMETIVRRVQDDRG
ncbi:MAG: chorismate synthase [Anaerolineales bacterium]